MTDLELQRENEELRRKLAEICEYQRKLEQTQAELRKSEAKYRIVAENTFSWEFWRDGNARFLYCSPSCERITGHKASEFLADPELHARLIHPDDRPSFDKHVIEVERRQLAGEGEWRFLRPDGAVIWVSHACRPVFDDQGHYTGCRGSNLDITERKQAEVALQESEQRMQHALSVSRSFTFEWEPFTDRVRRSASCANILRLSGEEAVKDTGQRYFQRVHPDDRERFVRMLRALTPAASNYVTEYRVVHGDGGTVTLEETGQASFDAAGRLMRLVGVATDVTARKQAEEGLRQSELRLQRAQVSAGAGIWDWDIPSGKLEWSEELFRLFGLDPEKQQAGFEVWSSILHPEDKRCAEQKIEAAVKDHTPLNSEYRILLPSGQVRWINALGDTIYDANGKPQRMSGICLDITARKRVEEDLQHIQLDLNRAQAVAHTGSWRLDVEKNELTWSDENHHIFGIPKGIPLTYETFLSTVHPEDRERVDRYWKAALSGEPYDIVHRIIVGEKIKWVREKAELEFDKEKKLLGGFGTTQDITGLKEAEDALLRSKREWERTFDSVPDLIAILDDKRRIVRLNKAMAERLGRSIPQCIGRTCCGEVHGTSVPPANCPHALTLMDGREHMAEVHEQHLGGDFLVSTTPLHDEQGKLIGAVHVARDITARKQAEDILKRDKETFEKLVMERTMELMETEMKLASAKRLADVGALAATVAHELRTPLSVIRIAAYNMRQKTKSRSLEKHISHIEKKIAESDQIINNLLFFSRVKIPNPETVRVHDLLDECIENTEKMFKKWNAHVEKKYTAPPGLCLEADPFQLREVFSNLLVNAYEALRAEKGRIRVVTQLGTGNRTLTILFEDDGEGIPSEYLARIHEPFFTTKPKGTGLGLSVCNQIIANHKGRIEVKSRKGEGATFAVVLPVLTKGAA